VNQPGAPMTCLSTRTFVLVMGLITKRTSSVSASEGSLANWSVQVTRCREGYFHWLDMDHSQCGVGAS